jgi:WD40 repeat protein
VAHSGEGCGTASPVSRGAKREGRSVQDGVHVVAHRKVFREFTSLRIAQQWQAHTGVIWTVSFSDTGAFMATSGKDRVIRVWENKRAPVEAGCALLSIPTA